MIRKPRRPARNRRALDPSNVPAGPFLPVSSGVNDNKLRLVFPGPVVVSGVPPITVNGAAAIAVTVVNAVTIELTYESEVLGTDEYAIPERMKEIRTARGGYLAAASGAVG